MKKYVLMPQDQYERLTAKTTVQETTENKNTQETDNPEKRSDESLEKPGERLHVKETTIEDTTETNRSPVTKETIKTVKPRQKVSRVTKKLHHRPPGVPVYTENGLKLEWKTW